MSMQTDMRLLMETAIKSRFPHPGVVWTREIEAEMRAEFVRQTCRVIKLGDDRHLFPARFLTMAELHSAEQHYSGPFVTLDAVRAEVPKPPPGWNGLYWNNPFLFRMGPTWFHRLMLAGMQEDPFDPMLDPLRNFAAAAFDLVRSHYFGAGLRFLYYGTTIAPRRRWDDLFMIALISSHPRGFRMVDDMCDDFLQGCFALDALVDDVPRPDPIFPPPRQEPNKIVVQLHPGTRLSTDEVKAALAQEMGIPESCITVLEPDVETGDLLFAFHDEAELGLPTTHWDQRPCEWNLEALDVYEAIELLRETADTILGMAETLPEWLCRDLQAYGLAEEYDIC